MQLGQFFSWQLIVFWDNSFPENKLLVAKKILDNQPLLGQFLSRKQITNWENSIPDNKSALGQLLSESRLIIRTFRFRQFIVIGTIPFQTINSYLDNFFPENELRIGTIPFEKENCLLGQFSSRQLAVFGTIPFENFVFDNLMSLGQFINL